MWASLLDRAVTIKRATITVDAGGGSIHTLATVASNVLTTIQAAGSYETESYSRRGITIDAWAYFVADLDTLLSGGIKIGDQIVDGATAWAVTSVRKELNNVLSSEPLYMVGLMRIVS